MLTTLILIFGFAVFAQGPETPEAASQPSTRDWNVKTESGVNTPEFSDCPACQRALMQSQTNAKGELMIVSLDRLNGRYSFNNLTHEDQLAILGELKPEDRETYAERARRLHLSGPSIPQEQRDPNQSIQERLGDKIAGATGMGGFRFKIGAKKFMIQYKKKF